MKRSKTFLFWINSLKKKELTNCGMPERTNDIIGARYQHVDLKPFDLHQS
jgi:hypothetical protein